MIWAVFLWNNPSIPGASKIIRVALSDCYAVSRKGYLHVFHETYGEAIRLEQR